MTFRQPHGVALSITRSGCVGCTSHTCSERQETRWLGHEWWVGRAVDRCVKAPVVVSAIIDAFPHRCEGIASLSMTTTPRPPGFSEGPRPELSASSSTRPAQSPSDEVRRLAHDLSQRMDPNSTATLKSLREFAEVHPILWVLGGLTGAVLGGVPFRKVAESLVRFDNSVIALAEATLLFTERGWVISSFVPIDAYREAIGLRRSGASAEEVDDALTDAWNAPGGPLENLAARLKVLGAADPALAAIAAQRARLVERAWVHHQAGAYEASIPIVLAQIDGITHDATISLDRPKGRTFYSKGNSQADVLDDATVAGIDYGLAAVRDWFSAAVEVSGGHGGGSRHGVLHGRDVAYDTKDNSTKCFVLLLAVWEWANRRLAGEAERRKQARYDQYAGSDDTDDNGWRLDRRGFTTARLRLSVVGSLQRQYRHERGKYATGYELALYPAAIRQLKITDFENIEIEVHPDAYWASLRSESGWVFSIGASAGTTMYCDDLMSPVNAPPGPKWRTTDDGNWSGDCYW
jgi:hypothetical protein